MAKKHRGIVFLVIINIFLIALVVGYHFLQVRDYYTTDIFRWIKKVFQKEVSVYKILYDKRLQYILLSLMYVALFWLSTKFEKTIHGRKTIAVVVSVLYSLHIFIDDTFVNYRIFTDRYFGISKLSLTEFAISVIWNNAISKYGFFIILINFGLMCALLFMITFFKTDVIDDDDWLFNEDDDDDDTYKVNERGDIRRRAETVIKNYEEEDVGAVRVIELYINDAIGYKAVIDYIDSLPVNDINGLKSLKLIESTIAEMHPVIEAAVRKAKTTKYRKMIETYDTLGKLISKQSEQEDGKVVSFNPKKNDPNKEDGN